MRVRNFGRLTKERGWIENEENYAIISTNFPQCSHKRYDYNKSCVDWFAKTCACNESTNTRTQTHRAIR